MIRRAAVYVRVSTEEQSIENQLAPIRQFAELRDLHIVEVYAEEESAWRGGRQRELARLMRDAWNSKFTVVLVWSLDRLSRGGVSTVLGLVHRLGSYGVRLVSLRESWTEAPGQLAELLYSITAWVAEMESIRISERTKAGLERARANGKVIGRPPGKKDSKPRKGRSRVPVWETFSPSLGKAIVSDQAPVFSAPVAAATKQEPSHDAIQRPFF